MMNSAKPFFSSGFYIDGKLPKYLAICFQVSAYEEQLFHCEPQMNADERGRPVCRGIIRGL